MYHCGRTAWRLKGANQGLEKVTLLRDPGPETLDNWKMPGSKTGKNHKLRTNIDSAASLGLMPISQKS